MPKTRTSFIKGLTGKNHPAWKGGLCLDRAEYTRTYNRERLRQERTKALSLLGNRCGICGFSDIRALQIDHVKGGGSKERKERNYTGSFNSNVIKSVIAGECKYQLLCANCNWIKRHENKE